MREKISPTLFHLCITDYCQLKCKHCYFGNYERLRSMTLDDVVKATNKFFALKKYFLTIGYKESETWVNISGGEPLLNKEVIPILKYVAPKFDHLKFLSNGILYDKNVCETIIGCFENPIYQISLDGMEKNHNIIRGKGTFEKSIETIKKIKKDFPHLYVQISCNIHHLNLDDMIPLMEYCKNLGVDKIFFDRYVKYWDSGLAMLTKEEHHKFIENIKYGVNNLNDDKFFIYTKRSMQLDDYVCLAGVGNQICCANGDRLACTRYHLKTGNFFTDSVSELAKKAISCEELTTQTPKECLSCVYCDSCNGGMRCITYASLGVYDKKDIHCWKYKKKVEENA